MNELHVTDCIFIGEPKLIDISFIESNPTAFFCQRSGKYRTGSPVINRSPLRELTNSPYLYIHPKYRTLIPNVIKNNLHTEGCYRKLLKWLPESLDKVIEDVLKQRVVQTINEQFRIIYTETDEPFSGTRRYNFNSSKINGESNG